MLLEDDSATVAYTGAPGLGAQYARR